MKETVETLAKLSVLVFVVSGMFSMGLGLTMSQILGSLRDGRLVAKALVANFVLAPAIAYLVVLAVPLSQAQSIGLVLLATAAGAPFLPKLVQVAKGDVAFGVGLMVLLMVATVPFVPLVLPLLLPGVSVNPLDIASSLVVLMLVPLGVGLVIRARYGGLADSLQPVMTSASNLSLVTLMVLMLVLNFQSLVGVIGTGALLALLAFIVATFAIGYLFGGPEGRTRPVLALGTAQRNVSAALVVAAQNFRDPDVLVMLVVGAILMLIVLMVAGGELGRRTQGG